MCCGRFLLPCVCGMLCMFLGGLVSTCMWCVPPPDPVGYFVQGQQVEELPSWSVWQQARGVWLGLSYEATRNGECLKFCFKWQQVAIFIWNHLFAYFFCGMTHCWNTQLQYPVALFYLATSLQLAKLHPSEVLAKETEDSSNSLSS